MGRALDELGIASIGARSPQAKGRVERLWGTLQSTMARLDGEEAEARRPAKTMDRRTTLAYLADLPRLWEETSPERHRPLAEAMFERIEVLGPRKRSSTPRLKRRLTAGASCGETWF